MIMNKDNILTTIFVPLIRFHSQNFTHLNISSELGMDSHYRNRILYGLTVNVLIFYRKKIRQGYRVTVNRISEEV